MADYPNTIFSPRPRENKSGVVYDADKKTTLFNEDLVAIENEVIAMQNVFRFPLTIPDSPVAGSAYFTVDDCTLHIYTGSVWKITTLGDP